MSLFFLSGFLLFLAGGVKSPVLTPGALQHNGRSPPKGITVFLKFIFMYFIQHCIICRPSESTVMEDAGMEPRTVAIFALAVRRSNHLARSHPSTKITIMKTLILILETGLWQTSVDAVLVEKASHFVKNRTFLIVLILPWQIFERVLRKRQSIFIAQQIFPKKLTVSSFFFKDWFFNTVHLFKYLNCFDTFVAFCCFEKKLYFIMRSTVYTAGWSIMNVAERRSADLKKTVHTFAKNKLHKTTVPYRAYTEAEEAKLCVAVVLHGSDPFPHLS